MSRRSTYDRRRGGARDETIERCLQLHRPERTAPRRLQHAFAPEASHYDGAEHCDLAHPRKSTILGCESQLWLFGNMLCLFSALSSSIHPRAVCLEMKRRSSQSARIVTVNNRYRVRFGNDGKPRYCCIAAAFPVAPKLSTVPLDQHIVPS
jgi:hypothetical protein